MTVEGRHSIAIMGGCASVVKRAPAACGDHGSAIKAAASPPARPQVSARPRADRRCTAPRPDSSPTPCSFSGRPAPTSSRHSGSGQAMQAAHHASLTTGSPAEPETAARALPKASRKSRSHFVSSAHTQCPSRAHRRSVTHVPSNPGERAEHERRLAALMGPSARAVRSMDLLDLSHQPTPAPTHIWMRRTVGTPDSDGARQPPRTPGMR
jgi:hypothetical protein